MPRHGSRENPHNLKGLPGYNPEIEGIQEFNAQDRSEQTYIHGGRVTEGVTGQLGTPSISPPPITPSISPFGGLEQPQMGIPRYKKGGKVNKKNGYKK